jgi:hypothetical protein
MIIEGPRLFFISNVQIIFEKFHAPHGRSGGAAKQSLETTINRSRNVVTLDDDLSSNRFQGLISY